MAKFLLLIAIFIIAYLFIRSTRVVARTHRENKAGNRPTEDMVRCKVCGVHLPRSESVTSRGEFFCSKEHLALADKGQPGR
jgi:uncharacterized protein